MIKPTVIYRKVCRPPSRSLGILPLLFCMGVISETCAPPPNIPPTYEHTHAAGATSRLHFTLFMQKPAGTLEVKARATAGRPFFSLTSRVGVWLPSRFLSNSNLIGLRLRSRADGRRRLGSAPLLWQRRRHLASDCLSWKRLAVFSHKITVQSLATKGVVTQRDPPSSLRWTLAGLLMLMLFF